MDQASHSGRLEDNRFLDAASFKKKDLPHQLHWFLEQDYLSREVMGFYADEVNQLKRVASEAYDIFIQATDKIIKERGLHKLGIPTALEKCIYHTWERRDSNPLLLGRFDINGGLQGMSSSVIEFNADTCSTLPETLYWQPLQLGTLPYKFQQFNDVQNEVASTLQNLARRMKNTTPVILASSLGYEEDMLNATAMLDIANKAGYQTFYLDLEHVVFADDGIYYNVNQDEYIKADIWYKIIPWDWIFTEEPELGKLLSNIILNDHCTILNPPYTTIWQNKLFLAYITENFKNSVIAETHTELTWTLTSYAKKPVYGRIGENVLLKDPNGKETSTKGDFGKQKMVYQKYYPLPLDRENYSYQIGIFYSQKPCGLNLRTQDSLIITEDCEFMSHFIL
jgi:glutathionylspermidine synthase